MINAHNILWFICTLSALGILHTYLFYPIIMMLFTWGKKELRYVQYETDDVELPEIDVLIAAHNEDKVIEQKITSIISSDYPMEKINIVVGSDCSTDKTNEMLEALSQKYSNLKVVKYLNRQGKTKVINKLIEYSKGDIVVYTDANVFFKPDMLFELIRYFKEDKIGVVCANIVPVDEKEKVGIARQESTYLKLDTWLKYKESLWGGNMIGAVGGCYAIRRELVQKVPDNFIVDDFYISMQVFYQKYKAILNLKAIAYEEVSVRLSEEFRRKVRISSGNFQNLFKFIRLWLFNFRKVGFAFFSHKVLRWITPFLMVVHIATLISLALWNQNYKMFVWIEMSLIFITFAEILMTKLRLEIPLLRFLTHFASMNLALMIGFFKYIFGVKSSVWKPTERNQ